MTVNATVTGAEGSGATVTAGSVSVSGTAQVDEGKAFDIVITPDSSSVVTSYSVVGTDGSLIDASEADYAGSATAITVEVKAEKATGTITVNVTTEKKETIEDTTVNQTDRKQGQLAWVQTFGKNVPYATALTANYNAKVTSYLLDDYFGNSPVYGSNKFADPVVKLNLTFSNNQSFGTGNTAISLGNVNTSGVSPIKNRELDSKLITGVDNVTPTAADVIPGKVTQVVEADYYTGGEICTTSGHWYHIYNVQKRADGMDREFTIDKDVLHLYNADSKIVGDAFTISGATADAPQMTAISNPTLLPDSYGIEGTQVTWNDAGKANFEIYRTKDAAGNELEAAEKIENLAFNKAGTYEVRVKEAVAETPYLKGYAAGDVVQTFTIERGTNPTEMEAPAVEIHATSLVITGAANGAQEYSIDGGNTWVKPVDGKVVFDNLTENTKYTVKTRIPADQAWNEKTIADTDVTTYINVAGSIAMAEGDTVNGPLVKEGTVVTFTDKKDSTKTYTAVVDADGNYKGEVPAGEYSVTALQADGLMKESAPVALSLTDAGEDGPNAVNTIIMVDSPKGTATKWLDKNELMNKGTAVNTVESGTIDRILAARDGSKGAAKYADLTAEVKNALDSLVNYTGKNGTNGFAGMIKDAEEQVKATATEYATALTGVDLNNIPDDKMDTITALKERWDTLSEAEQKAVDEKLGYSFATLAENNQKQADAAANVFIADHLTEGDGSITSTVSEANYKNILDGADEFFNQMNNTKRAAVNKKLADGVTYEQLYLEAYRKELEAKKAELKAPPLTAEQKKQLEDAMDGALGGAVTEFGNAKTAEAKALAQKRLDAQMQVLDMIAKQISAINSQNTTGAKDALTEAVTSRLLNGAVEKIKTAADAAEIKAYVDAATEVNNAISAAREEVNRINNSEHLTAGQKVGFVSEINGKIDDLAKADVSADSSAVGNALKALNDQVAATHNDAVAQEFVNKVVSGKNGDKYQLYEGVTSKNADQILGGKAEYEAMTDAVKAKVDALIAKGNDGKAGAPKSYGEYLTAVDKLIQDSVDSFIPKYVTGADGKLITAVTASTVDKLLSGKSTWDAMSKAEQDAIDAKLVADGGVAYSELLADAVKMDEKGNEFIKTYVSDKDGIVYDKATKDNYGQILRGRSAWNAMTQDEKNAINAKLFDQVGTTYEELLKGALEMQAKCGPATGDTANVALWAGLLLTSCVALAVLLAMKKRAAM